MHSKEVRSRQHDRTGRPGRKSRILRRLPAYPIRFLRALTNRLGLADSRDVYRFLLVDIYRVCLASIHKNLVITGTLQDFQRGVFVLDGAYAERPHDGPVPQKDCTPLVRLHPGHCRTSRRRGRSQPSRIHEAMMHSPPPPSSGSSQELPIFQFPLKKPSAVQACLSPVPIHKLCYVEITTGTTCGKLNQPEGRNPRQVRRAKSSVWFASPRRSPWQLCQSCLAVIMQHVAGCLKFKIHKFLIIAPTANRSLIERLPDLCVAGCRTIGLCFTNGIQIMTNRYA